MKFNPMICLPVLLGLLITSCDGQGSNTTGNKEGQSKVTASKFKEGQDYIEFKRARVLDKVGFTKPVEACSILIPSQ
jgi:hypothetical protein